MLGESVVGLYDLFFPWHAHVDVLAEDDLPLGHPAKTLYHPLVALLAGDFLVLVRGERVGSG
jgi:hypothetical protein